MTRYTIHGGSADADTQTQSSVPARYKTDTDTNTNTDTNTDTNQASASLLGFARIGPFTRPPGPDSERSAHGLQARTHA